MSDKKALKDDQEIVVRQVPFVDHGFSYAQEKLGVAVWKMATGLDGLKARLADAYLELAVLQASDLPPELVEEWKQIKADLTGGKMQYEQRAVGGKMTRLPVGLVPSTLRYMRKKKAHDIACRIHALEAKLDSFTEETSDQWCRPDPGRGNLLHEDWRARRSWWQRLRRWQEIDQ